VCSSDLNSATRNGCSAVGSEQASGTTNDMTQLRSSSGAWSTPSLDVKPVPRYRLQAADSPGSRAAEARTLSCTSPTPASAHGRRSDRRRVEQLRQLRQRGGQDP